MSETSRPVVDEVAQSLKDNLNFRVQVDGHASSDGDDLHNQVLSEDQPVVFLYWRDSLPAVSSRVYGIQPGPAGIKWNFTDWFVPKQLQRYTAN
jgi:hypothetical protein